MLFVEECFTALLDFYKIIGRCRVETLYIQNRFIYAKKISLFFWKLQAFRLDSFSTFV